ncbi:MAG: Gfo/Idh/MocA family protein [Armatimonadota bacterium]
MVRVGLAGLGFMGGTHAQCHAAIPSSKLAAVCDVEKDRREKFAQAYGATPYASLDEMLKADIDVVDLCLPTYLHREAVEAAAKAKKHILCEKPMALTAAECDAMIAAVKKAGVEFMVGHVIRFWPEYVVIKQILDSGKLGKIKWMSATRMSAPPTWSWQEWIFDPKRSGGAVLDLHIHDLDFLAWTLGRPKTVSATGTKAKKGGLDNVFTTMTGAPSGAVGFAEGSLDMAGGFPFTMGLKINLEGGSIEFNSRLSPSLLVAHADGSVTHPDVPQPEVPAVAGAGSAGNISALGGYFVEVNYFVDCVDKGRKPTTVTAEEAKYAVELCLAATKSAETGRPVAL